MEETVSDDLKIRFATPKDVSPLRRIEKSEFPDFKSVFKSKEMVARGLVESVAAQIGVLTVVAELNRTVVGFALSMPRRYYEGNDPDHLVLQYLAVRQNRRGVGIGSALLADTELRAARAGRHLIFAHIPHTALHFYSRAGWHVVPPKCGVAWLSKSGEFFFNEPESSGKYTHMAFKVLQPTAVARTFTFPVTVGIPAIDAGQTLIEALHRGDVNFNTLDELAKELVHLVMSAPRKQ